jgi:type II restriction/modification system DNA methylase subunit YeeA
VQREVETLSEKMHFSNTAKRKRELLGQMEAKLFAFTNKIRQLRVLDPACGSGNFLYVSLKELLDLEKEVSTFAGKMGLTPFFPEVSPEQLYGIETSPYAHELAQVAIWIGYLQWMVENGFGTRQQPILGPMTNILEMDAILVYGADGSPVEPQWPEADVIVGNPPFMGDKRMRSRLGDAYVEDLRGLYKGRVSGSADLVCYWFEKARKLIEVGKISRAGLLATQAIRGGANREVLKHIKESGDIFFAESDRPWVQEGVAVQVSMVGFDDGSELSRMRDGVAVSAIFADLTADLDLSMAKPLPENEGIAFQGPVVVGPFDIDSETARTFFRQYNPHGRPNSEVISPVANAADLTGRRRGRYIIDFGQRSEDEASLYEGPFEYVRQHVKPLRDRNRDPQRRQFWWRHGRSGTELRTALRDKSRQLVTPRVSSHHHRAQEG